MNIKRIIFVFLCISITCINAMESGKRKRSDSFNQYEDTTVNQTHFACQAKCVRQNQDLEQVQYLENQSGFLASNEILERMFDNKLNEWKNYRALISTQINVAIAQGKDPNSLQLFVDDYQQMHNKIKILEDQLVIIYNRLALIQQKTQINFNELYNLLIELKRI